MVGICPPAGTQAAQVFRRASFSLSLRLISDVNSSILSRSAIISSTLALCVQGNATDWTGSLCNEDETLRFTLMLEHSVLCYEVSHKGSDGTEALIIERSPLGLTRQDADFTDGLIFVSASAVRMIDEKYTLLVGKRREVHNRALEQSFTFRGGNGESFQITVRAMPDGVAFRYGFPGSTASELLLTGEATGFKLPSDGVAWMQPYDRTATWAPAYEAEYRNRIPVDAPAPEESAGWCFPALFSAKNRWLLLTEAGMDGTCYAAHLMAKTEGALYHISLPEVSETYGVARKEARISLPWQSPWRVIVVGSTPATIVETNAVTNLSAPCELEDTSWIKPGRVSWSWWSDKSSPADYNRLVPYIDLAADYRWEYSLIDANWHQMINGDIRKLLEYAKTKNVGLILWYNSGGPHNRILDAGPRDLMYERAKRETEMAKLENWGVKGIKVDFMQSDKQDIIQLYIDILRDAAKHHLVVDFHGCTIPRGWARTFPNLLTQEAVRGAEQYWDPNFAEHAQALHTIYIFTRNVVGSMDYTPVTFGLAPELQMHKTTNAHELALSVAFESGLQHFADSVADYRAQPPYVQDFLRIVPVVWDEIRCIDGQPGAMALLARRKGNVWFVAALNGETTAKTVKVPFGFLGPGQYIGEFVVDGQDPRQTEWKTISVSAGDTLSFNVLGRGGFVGRLVRGSTTQIQKPTHD